MFYQFNHFGFSEYFLKENGENFNFPVHLHHSFELIIVLSGEMRVTIDNERYLLRQNEAVIVFPNRLHSLESTESRHLLFIFSPELVKAYNLKVKNMQPENSKFKVTTLLLSCLLSLDSDSSVLEKKGTLYLACSAFDKCANYCTHNTPDKNLLMQIFTFVENNFQKKCSLTELAEKSGYSYSYISRCFKKTTGISFNAYVNQYRIRNACYLLSSSDATILQCALDSGYTSLRSFNRNFYEILKITPSQYRNRLQK